MPKKLSNIEENTIFEMYKSNFSVKETVKLTGLSYPTVLTRFKYLEYSEEPKRSKFMLIPKEKQEYLIPLVKEFCTVWALDDVSVKDILEYAKNKARLNMTANRESVEIIESLDKITKLIDKGALNEPEYYTAR